MIDSCCHLYASLNMINFHPCKTKEVNSTEALKEDKKSAFSIGKAEGVKGSSTFITRFFPP